jgi:hypothetical protein
VPPTHRQRRRRTDPKPATPEPQRDNESRRRTGDRGLRGLETVRSTQLSPVDAMRAREYGRPSPEDLAQAERDVVVVRRNYVPPAPLQTTKRRGRRRDDQRG